MLKKYNDITVFETNKIDDMQDADIIKIVLPTSIENENKMKEIGFLFADRTLGVSIQLSKTELNFDKLIRLPIEETDGYKTEIEEIALKSFPYDRRFHLKLNYDDEELFKLIIKEWVNDLDNVLVAKYQSTVVGFLALKETDSDTLFVHLPPLMKNIV